MSVVIAAAGEVPVHTSPPVSASSHCADIISGHHDAHTGSFHQRPQDSAGI